MPNAASFRSSDIPTIGIHIVGLMFIAGFFVTDALGLWGQLISPGLSFANLSPHGLAKSLLATFGLTVGDFAGHFVHFYLVCLIGYPIGFVFFFKPLCTQFFGAGYGWFIPAAIYGLSLWLLAIGGISVTAGLSFFLGFFGVDWVAVVGHVLSGVVFVAVTKCLIQTR